MAVSACTAPTDMSEACTFADAANLRELDTAAEGLDPRLVSLVLASEGLASLEDVPKSKVAVVCSSLRACTPSWPPLPLTSSLDQQR